MEPLNSIPPEKGVRFSKVHWPMYRINAKLEDFRLYRDYEIEDGDYIKYYPSDSIKGATGTSCFMPLGDPDHNLPLSKEVPCYFLPPGTSLPSKLALVYTNEMKLRFPKNIKQGWHFIIVATERMTKNEYIQAVKDLDWQICKIRATAYPNKLVLDKDDLKGVKDFRIVELYWLMFNIYMEDVGCMERFYLNDVHTWIALDHPPSFKDLLQHKTYACIVFSILARMDISSVNLETFKFDILNELEEAFGWDLEKFNADYKENQKAGFTEENSGFDEVLVA